MSETQPWRSRIVGHGKEPVADLINNPKNWRRHPIFQKESLAAVIQRIGFIRSVTKNITTGNLIDGHLRVLLAKEQQEETIDTEFVELSEEEEILALATFDPLAELAETDKQQLEAVLREAQAGDAAVQKLLDEIGQKEGILPADVDFKEFDESIADDVKYHECPQCGHRWPQ